MSLLTPKLPPYMRKKSPPPGGFFGKPVPPNSPYHLTMSIPVFPANHQPALANGNSPTRLSPVVLNLPRGLVPLEHQVAGHSFRRDNPSELGLLKRADGTVLKPAGKAQCGAREIQFYESLEPRASPPDQLVALRELVPRFHGPEVLSIDGREVTFLRLEDLTDRMLEPCVMDVKIGRRTWDPLASAEKRAAEESKYVACKTGLGFCVPGFQVHSVRTGRVKRFGKEYGKRLDEHTVRDAFRLFLNADSGLSRSLLMQFLSGLWAIQAWARTQTQLRVFSSSVLLVYDARRLREVLAEANKRQGSGNSTPTTLTTNGGGGGGGVGLHRSVSSASSVSSQSSLQSPGSPVGSAAGLGEQPVQSFKKIQRNHSVNNNYDQDMREMQVDYVLMLDNLLQQNAERRKEWAGVKMIDFAHTFPSEDLASVDQNYLFGIESLVKLFEDFLQECTD